MFTSSKRRTTQGWRLNHENFYGKRSSTFWIAFQLTPLFTRSQQWESTCRTARWFRWPVLSWQDSYQQQSIRINQHRRKTECNSINRLTSCSRMGRITTSDRLHSTPCTNIPCVSSTRRTSRWKSLVYAWTEEVDFPVGRPKTDCSPKKRENWNSLWIQDCSVAKDQDPFIWRWITGRRWGSRSRPMLAMRMRTNNGDCKQRVPDFSFNEISFPTFHSETKPWTIKDWCTFTCLWSA